MKDLFYDDGHLTDEAFRALIDSGPLDELERLEIAEHLSFCDQCVERYAALLDDGLLAAPPEPVAPPVLARLRERARKVFFNRYTTAIAAACFAIVFWNIGVFNIDVQRGQGKVLEAVSNGAAAISARTTQLTGNITEAFDKILNSLGFERGSTNEKE